MPYSTDALAGRVILVAEDEYMLADAMESAICSAGAEVLGPYPSIEETLEHLARFEGQPDAAVLNVRLLDGDSYPIADELVRRGVPFVFASASNVAALPARLAGSAMVPKPYSPHQVVQALMKLLNLAEAPRI